MEARSARCSWSHRTGSLWICGIQHSLWKHINIAIETYRNHGPFAKKKHMIYLIKTRFFFFPLRKPFFFSFWEGDSSIAGQETLVHGCLTTGHSYEAKLSDPEIGELVDGWRCSAMGFIWLEIGNLNGKNVGK